jgi:hypothetical protein
MNKNIIVLSLLSLSSLSSGCFDFLCCCSRNTKFTYRAVTPKITPDEIFDQIAMAAIREQSDSSINTEVLCGRDKAKSPKSMCELPQRSSSPERLGSESSPQ